MRVIESDDEEDEVEVEEKNDGKEERKHDEDGYVFA